MGTSLCTFVQVCSNYSIGAWCLSSPTRSNQKWFSRHGKARRCLVGLRRNLARAGARSDSATKGGRVEGSTGCLADLQSIALTTALSLLLHHQIHLDSFKNYTTTEDTLVPAKSPNLGS